MKNFLKVAISFGAVLMAATVAHATGNLVTGLAVATIATYAVSHLTGFSILEEIGIAGCQALVGVKRKCQTLTIGGAKRLYVVLAEDLATEFLTYDLAKSAGKFTGAIPLVAGKKFIEVEAWYDTTKFDTEMKIGAGFTQSLEYKLLGYNEEIVKYSALMYETPVCYIVQGNDDKLYFVGQKYIPMMTEMKGVLPEKGTARKEATFSAKEDGMMIPVFPLDSSVTFEVEPLAGVEEPEGGA